MEARRKHAHAQARTVVCCPCIGLLSWKIDPTVTMMTVE
jgi:hypothetical protein